MNVTKPPKLSPGDTIGIVSSSLPLIPSYKKNYEEKKKILKGLGFRIRVGKTIGPIKGWMGGTPKEVAKDINSMFADESVKAIFAADGGYSAISVIDYLDYELITNNPKPFMGFSDMTIYHLAILKETGMVGFHMDYLSSLNSEFFKKFLMSSDAPGIIKPLSEWEEWPASTAPALPRGRKRGEKKVKAEGQLIGGLLERISVLAGTKYFPPLEYFEGSILFWEQVGGDITDIYQYLYQLKNMGIFEKINGMLIGKINYLKSLRNTEIIVPEIKDMILEIVKDYNFPIMANMDFGHFTTNIPMPIGIKVSFDTEKKELKFLESPVV